MWSAVVLLRSCCGLIAVLLRSNCGPVERRLAVWYIWKKITRKIPGIGEIDDSGVVSRTPTGDFGIYREKLYKKYQELARIELPDTVWYSLWYILMENFVYILAVDIKHDNI